MAIAIERYENNLATKFNESEEKLPGMTHPDSDNPEGKAMNEAILAILSANGINPGKMVGERTAQQVMEAAVMGALDEIEETE